MTPFSISGFNAPPVPPMEGINASDKEVAQYVSRVNEWIRVRNDARIAFVRGALGGIGLALAMALAIACAMTWR